MKEEDKQNWSLAITLTKAVLEEAKSTSPDENAFEMALNKLKDSRPLETTEYDLMASLLSKYTPNLSTFKLADLSTLVQFLEVLWLNISSLQWDEPGKILNSIESLGKSALHVIAALVGGLPTLVNSLAYPKEVKRAERRLFELYEIYTSSLSFSDRAVKLASISAKLQKDAIIKLLPPLTDIKVPYKSAKRIDEILLIAQQKPVAVFVESPVPPELSKLMSQLHIYATKNLKMHHLWIDYFIYTLNTETLAETPPWSSDRSKAGWGSFNICVLALEHFFSCEDMPELRQKLVDTFTSWSHKALCALVQLVQDSDQSKAELVATLYSAYMFPIFIFYGYLSRGNPETAMVGAELATDIIQRLLQTDLNKVLTSGNTGIVFESLYFLFSYMCKQVGKHMMNGGFTGAQKTNYIELGLKLFEYIINCVQKPGSGGDKSKGNKGGMVWDISLSPEKPVKKKPKAAPAKLPKKVPLEPKPESSQQPPQEALDSLEEIVAMLGCLVGNCSKSAKPLINSWLSNENTVLLLLKIIDSAKDTIISGIIGKLVIEMTQKDACYGKAQWQTIVSTISKYFAETSVSFNNGYMLALLLKLALCCCHKLGQTTELEGVQKLWLEVVKCLMQKNAERKQERYKEIAILFLLQTILKPNGEAILSDLFIEALARGKPQHMTKHYELFLKVSAALPLETEAMKVCSDLLSSILLKGVEPTITFMDFSNLNIANAFRKLTDISKKIGREDLLSLDNLAGLQETTEFNKPLFDQLLGCPDLIKFNEEFKMDSPNHYLHALLGIARADLKVAGEILQENLLALVQCYMGLEYTEDTSKLVYLQTVLHSYVLFTLFALQKGVVLSSPQDVLEFINFACDHGLRLLEAELVAYYQALLDSKKELLPFTTTLKDLTMVCKDIKETLQKLGLAELDVSFLFQATGPGTVSFILDSLYSSFISAMNDPNKSHEAITKVLETHFSTHFPGNPSMPNICKSILSTIFLLHSFIESSTSLVKMSENPPNTTLQALARIGSTSVVTSGCAEVKGRILEICKTLAPAAPEQLQKAVSGLVFMENVGKALNTVFQGPMMTANKEIAQKAVEVLLELWSFSAKNSGLGTGMMEDVAKDISGYDFAGAIKEITSLLGTEGLQAEVAMQILISVFECISENEGKAFTGIIQEQILKCSNGLIKGLFVLKDQYLHKILGKLMVECVPLQQKLFTIITDLILSSQDAASGLTANLELLTQIINSSRETYIPVLINKILPFAQSSPSEQLQSTLLNYLSSMAYPHLSIQYPRGSIAKSEFIEPGDDLPEGYGVENYTKKEEPLKPNTCCTLIRTRRKNEVQPCYHCYTCNITDSKICCSVCAKVCHKGHKVVFAKNAQMHCTCQNEGVCLAIPKEADVLDSEHGAAYYLSQYRRFGGIGKHSEWMDDRISPPISFPKYTEISMRAHRLKEDDNDNEEEEDSELSESIMMEEVEDSPEKNSEDVVVGSSLSIPPALPTNKSEGQLSPSEHSFDEKTLVIPEIPLPPRDIPYEKTNSSIPVITCDNPLNKKEAKFAQTALTSFCEKALETKAGLLAGSLLESLKQKMKKSEQSNEKLLAKTEKTVRSSTSLAQAKQVYDVMAPNPPKKGPSLVYAELPSSFRSYLSHMPTARGCITTNKAGLMAIAFRDHLNIYNAEAIANESESKSYGTDKTKLPPIAKVQLNFLICSAKFNEANEAYLAVAGVRDCVVVTLDPATGQTVSKLPVDLMLQAMGEEFTITKIQWIPKSQVHLAVAAHLFVKIYDLSTDNIAPIYTLNSMESGIKEMNILPEQDTTYRFFLASGNSVNTAVVEVPPKADQISADNDIDLVESIEFPENVKSSLKSTHLVSLYFAPKSRLLFLTLGNGRIVYGELNITATKMKRATILSMGEDTNSNKYLFDLQEVESTENALWLCGMSMSNQLQAILLKIEENEAHIQVLRQKIEGSHLFHTKTKGFCKILTPSDDAYVGSFAPVLNGPVSKKSQFLVKSGEHAKLLEKSRLPHSVSLPIDHLEKAVNVLDPSVNLSKKIKVNGTINLLVGKDHLALFEWIILGRGGNQFPVGIPPVSVDISLVDTPDYVIAGIRVLAETGPKQFVNIFNRKVPLGTVAKNVTEIGFCDAEILSIENNTFSFTLEAEETPIKLKGIEVYVFHKDVFGFFEKVGKLEQAVLRKADSKSAELSRFAPIVSTKTYEVLPWNEKMDLLNTAVENQDALKALVGGLEFLSSVAYASEPVEEAVADNLLNKLADYLYVGIEDGVPLKIFRSTARKFAKAVIYNVTQGKERMEGNKFNYATYKSKALFSYLNKLLKEAPTFDALEKYLKSLGKLAIKSRLYFFERISQSLDTLARISILLLELLEKVLEGDDATEYKARAKEALNNYITIAMGYYDFLLNTEWRVNEKDPKKSPHSIIQSTHIERVATLLGPYMLSKNEEVKSLLITVLSEHLPKRDIEYIHTCQSPVLKKYNGKEFEVRSFDFSYVLGLGLCKYMLDRLNDNKRFSTVTIALLRELFYNFSLTATHLKTVDGKNDEDWANLFSNLINIALVNKKVLNPSERELVFLGLKLLNSLLFSPAGDSKRKSIPRKEKPLSLDSACKLLVHVYQNTGLIDWITASVGELFMDLKERKGESEPMQDVSDKKTFLKIKPKSNMKKGDSIQSFIGELPTTGEGMEEALFQELFRLCYNLATYEQLASKLGKGTEPKALLKSQATLKTLKDILCETLLTPGLASGLDSSAQSLFKMLSKSKGELNQYRDNYVYSLGLKALQAPMTNYESQVNTYKQLSAIWKVAKERPVHWKTYAKNNLEMLNTLFAVGNTMHERIAFQALALVCLALEDEEYDGFNIKSSCEMLSKYPAHTLDIIDILKYSPLLHSKDMAEEYTCPPEVFTKGLEIADKYSLESVSLHMRVVSAHLLRGLWDTGNKAQREQIYAAISKKLTPEIYRYGCATLQLLSLCLCVFQNEGLKDVDLVLNNVFEGARKAAAIVHNHENAEIYKEVQGMIVAPKAGGEGKEKRLGELLLMVEEGKEFLYCLEEVPCNVCISDIGQSYSTQKVNDIKEDSRFTDSAYIYKLSNSYSIQKISIRFDFSDTKYVKTINAYTSTAKDTDLSDLRNNWSMWKKAASMSMKPRNRNAVLEFPVPITTSLLMIEFVPSSASSEPTSSIPTSYYASRGIDMIISSGDSMLCPRCMRMVPSMHGICTSCGENMLQCPHCHNINYDKRDAFICTECGHSRYGKIEIMLSVRLGFATQKIAGEKDKAAMQAALSNTLNMAMRSHETLKKYKGKLASIVRSPVIKSGERAGRFIDIHDIYVNSCMPEYRKLVKLLRNANSMKSELLQYANQYSVTTEVPRLEPSANCYGCAEVFLQVFLKFVELSASFPLCCNFFKKGQLQNLLFNAIMPCSSPSIAKLLVKALISLGVNDMFFAEIIMGRLEGVLQTLSKYEEKSVNRAALREDLVLYMELLIRMHSRLTLLIVQKTSQIHYEIYTKVNSYLWKIFAEHFPIKNSLVGEEVIQPILDYTLQLLSLPAEVDVAQLKPTSENVVEAWTEAMKTSAKDVSRNILDPIMEQCLLFPECKSLRETTGKVLKRLFDLMPGTMIPTVEKTISMLDKVFDMPQENAESFMNILKHLIAKLDTEEGFHKNAVIKRLLDLSQKELDKLLTIQSSVKLKEDGIGKELWIGYSLCTAFELIQSMTNNNKEFFKNEAVTYQIIKCYAKAKKLLTITNNYIDKSVFSLESLFRSLPMESLEEKNQIIIQCLKIISENRDDEEVLSVLYSELYKLVNPEKPEPKYSVVLQKAATQEMFIRGALNKSPYSASDIGITMRDIRTKICKDLEMRDAEQIMELLVGNNIIELDLPIRMVYERVWWPYSYRRKNPDAEEVPPIESAKGSELEPMCVVYRLAGVDGEATENRIESLGEAKNTEDPEILSASVPAFAEDLGAGTGLEMMLEHLWKIGTLSRKKQLAEQIIRLLNILSKSQVCRKKLVQYKGTNVLAAKLIEFLPAYETPEGHIVDELIFILENVIMEANKSAEVGWLQGNVVDIDHIKKILEKLTKTCERMIATKENITKPGKHVGPLTRILPYFAYGSSDAVNVLVGYFKDWTRFAELDEAKDFATKQRVVYHTARLIEIIESIPTQVSVVRDALLSSGVTQSVVDYVKRWISENENDMQKCSNGLPTALKLLIGICKDHGGSQFLVFKSGILEPVYRLSLSKSTKEPLKNIEVLCEIFIEEIAKSPDTCKEAYDKAQELITKTKEEKKRQAEKKKAEIMKKMNIQKMQGMLKPKIDPSIFGEAKMEDEKGFTCIVCHEGYNFKPTDILGAYVYGKACDIRSSDNFADKYVPVGGVSTVTHFNLIHLSCHLNAVKAEKTMKQPKGEWEGATIRNSHTKCNNWLPIRGGSVKDGDYVNAVTKYFNNMRGIVKTEQPKSRIMANDIKFMLRKFAYEESFSHYSHGGGPLHNIQLIPFMVQLALFLGISGEYTVPLVDNIIASFFTVVSEIEKDLQSKAPLKIDSIKESEEDKTEHDLKVCADDFAYICTLMLLTYRSTDWATAKTKLITALLTIATNMAVNGVTARKREKKGAAAKIISISNSITVAENTSLEKPMKEVRPLLILLTLVDQLKGQQANLIQNEPATREELMQQLYEKLSTDHIKVNDLTTTIYKVYTEKLLELGTVEEFLNVLGAPKEMIEPFNTLAKTVIQ